MDFSDNGADDFDNFFGAKKTKKPTTKISDPIEDLFGLDDGKDARVPAPRKTVTKSLGVKSLLAASKGEDDDDDLGFDPKKPKGGVNKSQSLFDDLLTPLESKRPQTAGPPSKPPAISRQSTDTTTDTSNIFQTQARPKTSQGRRSSNLQNADPLGLFSKEKEPPNVPSSSGRSTPKTKKKGGSTADWLGLTTEAEPETNAPPVVAAKITTRPETPKANILPPAPTTTQDSAEILQIPDVREEHYEDSADELLNTERNPPVELKTKDLQDNIMIDSTAHNIRLMNTMNLEAKQSFTALKYQEQQLLMAAQMKQQEKVLMEMQQRQNSLLQQQERQFQTLLQQQMQRHHQLEDLIKQQQARINTHLHLLMSQPPVVDNPVREFDEGDQENVPYRANQNREKLEEDREREKQAEMNVIQLEADNKRLELENLRLEELVANSKNNYEREIEILEKTYKKQIEVLEKHLANLEKRLKSEIEELQDHFQKKIEILEEEKANIKTNYNEEIQNLKQDHEDELRKLKKNQEEDLEMIKEEHRRMLDNIRQAKMLEFAAVQENGSYLDCLRVASSNLSDLTGGLNELKENMQMKIDQIHTEREKKLEAREKRIEDAERRLKLNEESNETEKQRLLELVSTLELQMSKMSKDSAEENWQLRQKLASLDAEKAAFAKEREFFREQMLRDEERIKDLKELQLLETQRLQAQIQEERAQLQVEKSKFDLEKRLHANADTQKERQEIEAAMQVAQDAARKADAERERYYKMQRQLEQQKRELADKEHSLSVKEEELQQELMSFRMAERVAQETQQKAKMAEQFFHNKIQMLQQRNQEIAEKESNLSQERLLLAQDRIALHALKTKLSQQTKCSLCQLSQQNKDISDNLHKNISLVYDKPLEEFQLPQHRQTNFNMDFMGQSNAVERLLDANIADSLRKMTSSSNLPGWEMLLLDDDHKKMVQSHSTANHNNNINNDDDEYDVKRSSNI
ncbi:fas-binding factor 1 twitchy [Musca autumnalis]|uniref:fas-binding factor 1 twitchy n=1 Tax=Musca autumnalis TaxID=221902 RepID=UPI003CEB9C34